MSWASNILEYWRLRNAEEQVRARSPEQQRAVREYFDGAMRRLRAAQDARGHCSTPVALGLYGRGLHLLALAFLSANEGSSHDNSLSAQATFEKLDALFARLGLEPPAPYHRVRPLLVPATLIDDDRLPPEEAKKCLVDLDVASLWLTELVDPRSVREVKITRAARIGTTSAVVLGALVWGAIRIFSPPNLALHMPVTASPIAWDSSPEAAVDGDLNGKFGYHSSAVDTPWLIVDLGRSVAITKVKVYGRGDCCYEQSIPLQLELSEDGTSYSKVGDRKEGFSETNPWVIQLPKAQARFVRLLSHGAVLVLGEVEVYGRPIK